MRKWTLIFGIAFLLFLITMYELATRIHTMVRNRIERILQTHFESKVEFPISDLIDRLKLKGQFGIDEAQFASPQIQGKIDTLSRKGQGHPKDMDIDRAASEMKGNFQVSDGVVTFSNLNFGVVGASLNLSGTYSLDEDMPSPVRCGVVWVGKAGSKSEGEVGLETV